MLDLGRVIRLVPLLPTRVKEITEPGYHGPPPPHLVHRETAVLDFDISVSSVKKPTRIE